MKNKEIKQIIFSRKKNKKWIIIALVLVLTLGGGSVAAVVILHRNGNQSEFSMPGNMAADLHGGYDCCVRCYQCRYHGGEL